MLDFSPLLVYLIERSSFALPSELRHTFEVDQKARAVFKKYQCNYCRKRFTHRGDMDGHIASRHLNVKAYVCPVCNKSFSYSQNLKRHQKLGGCKKFIP